MRRKSSQANCRCCRWAVCQPIKAPFNAATANTRELLNEGLKNDALHSCRKMPFTAAIDQAFGSRRDNFLSFQTPGLLSRAEKEMTMDTATIEPPVKQMNSGVVSSLIQETNAERVKAEADYHAIAFDASRNSDQDKADLAAKRR